MNGIKACKTRTGLGSINELDALLVIWQRSLDPSLQGWINDMDATSLPDLRILAKPDEFRSALEPLLDACGLKSSGMRDRFVADINDLVVTFADITGGDYVDVRLERVNHDACWKFHRDTVETRLLTTYRGPTTEWVRHEYAEKAIQEQREYKGPLERFENGDVVIFKGSRASSDKGIVHRSPPISGTGMTRLLLCLNQRTGTSPKPELRD